MCQPLSLALEDTLVDKTGQPQHSWHPLASTEEQAQGAEVTGTERAPGGSQAGTPAAPRACQHPFHPLQAPPSCAGSSPEQTWIMTLKPLGRDQNSTQLLWGSLSRPKPRWLSHFQRLPSWPAQRHESRKTGYFQVAAGELTPIQQEGVEAECATQQDCKSGWMGASR